MLTDIFVKFSFIPLTRDFFDVSIDGLFSSHLILRKRQLTPEHGSVAQACPMLPLFFLGITPVLQPVSQSGTAVSKHPPIQGGLRLPPTC